MVCKAMGVSLITSNGFQLWCFALIVVVFTIQGCRALNSEGSVLLQFRARVTYDPHGIFENWDLNDNDPCTWSGIRCKDGRVQMLILDGLSLEGELAPGLGKLTFLRSLVLHDNNFVGAIPEEIGGLANLEVLDLRNNNFDGTIPAEIGNLQSLKRLLLCNNNFEGGIPLELGKLNQLVELQFDENETHSVSSGIRCVNRKLGHCIPHSSLKQHKKKESFIIPVKVMLLSYFNVLPLFKSGSTIHSPVDNCCDNLSGEPMMATAQSIGNPSEYIRRRLLQQSNNLVAEPANGGPPIKQIDFIPISQSSGSFPAVPKENKHGEERPASSSSSVDTTLPPQQNQSTSISSSSSKPTTDDQDRKTWKYVGAASGASFFFIIAAVVFITCRDRPVAAIGPWKTGLSGQLQKAFVTGVPKLNRSELETACEDFSNIIDTVEGCTIYKGTLSSGVEIAVASTSILSAKDWSKRSELAYRKKIDTLSRVNHKNFVNLIGYCEEDEPFTRMMVFEYAPNGTLFEHLHVQDFEHLDWSARMRIIMGTAYCIQHMHDLNPPVSHGNLDSNSISLTDDYAAKILEFGFWKELAMASKISGENETEHSLLPPLADTESNVYNFGLLLLEIISGKLPYSEEHDPLEKWASRYLNDQRNISRMIDPSLKSFKDNELDIICEVAQQCIEQDARKRPIMGEVTAKLREVITISPDAATPRFSPLWWAELEILSSEAA